MNVVGVVTDGNVKCNFSRSNNNIASLKHENFLASLPYVTPFLVLADLGRMLSLAHACTSVLRTTTSIVHCNQMNSAQVGLMKSLFDRLKVVKVLNCGEFNSFWELEHLLENMHAISLTRCCCPLPANGILTTRNRFESIRDISLKSCNSVVLAYILSSAPLVQRLSIEVIYEDIREILVRLLKRLKCLEELHLSRILVPSLSQRALAIDLVALPALKFLSITHSPTLSKLSLTTNASSATGIHPNKLKKVDISYSGLDSREISKLCSYCPHLQQLIACGSLNCKDTLELVSSSLQDIDLRYCTFLPSLRVSCHQLMSLQVNQCNDLYRLEVQSKSLLKLDLSMLRVSYVRLQTEFLPQLTLRGTMSLQNYLVINDDNRMVDVTNTSASAAVSRDVPYDAIRMRLLVSKQWDLLRGVLVLDNCYALTSKLDQLYTASETVLSVADVTKYIVDAASAYERSAVELDEAEVSTIDDSDSDRDNSSDNNDCDG